MTSGQLVRPLYPPHNSFVWLQVSCTITFDPLKEGQHLAHALDYFQYQLKGVSFLPRMDYGAFPQVCVRVGWPWYPCDIAALWGLVWATNGQRGYISGNEHEL